MQGPERVGDGARAEGGFRRRPCPGVVRERQVDEDPLDVALLDVRAVEPREDLAGEARAKGALEVRDLVDEDGRVFPSPGAAGRVLDREKSY